MVLNKIIGQKLKSLRIQNGFTVKKLNSILDDFCAPICIQTIYKWENGKTMPDLKSLNALATIYNISIGNFFNDDSKVQALTNDELKLISLLHTSKAFKRIVFLLSKIANGGTFYGD